VWFERFMLVFLIGAIVSSLTAGWGVNDSFGFQATDFGTYFRGGQRARTGVSPYVVDKIGPEGAFVYGPAYAWFFVPFTYLDYFPATRVWMLLNWGAALGCFWLGWKLLGNTNHDSRWLLLGCAGLFFANYFIKNIRYGQVGAFLAVLCLGWANCQRQGRQVWSGILLAAACFVKIVPILIVPYLVLRRQWRGLAALVVASLALFLVPAGSMGLVQTVQLHREWKEQLLKTSAAFQIFRISNQSMLGLLARTPTISNGFVCYDETRLFALAQLYPWLALAGAGLVYLWLWRRRTGLSSIAGENLELSVLFLFMTIANPRGWSYNNAVLILPCLITLRAVWERWRGWTFALTALAIVGLANVIPSPEEAPLDFSWLCFVHQSIHFWAMLAMTISVFFLRERTFAPQIASFVSTASASQPNNPEFLRRAA
jgi:hypothetical protein